MPGAGAEACARGTAAGRAYHLCAGHRRPGKWPGQYHQPLPPDRYRHAIVCLTKAGPFARRLTAGGVEVIELHKRPGHDLGMYWRLWRALRRLRPAIVHTRNLAALETQVLGLLMPGTKRVHGEHGRDVRDLEGTSRKFRLLRQGLNPLIHRFITVSQDLAHWLIETVHIAPRKVTQIYNGVDHARPLHAAIGPRPPRHPAGECRPAAPAGMPPGARVVGTVGRLAAVKDQQSLICALARIFQAHPQQRQTLRCILVGDGAERAAIEAAIARDRLEDVVWLAGDREDIPALLACMDVFVLPSLGEGISNTVLEAMATGLPVIATRVGGNPELVQDGVRACWCRWADAPALAAAILELVDDPARCEQMGRARRSAYKRSLTGSEPWQLICRSTTNCCSAQGQPPKESALGMCGIAGIFDLQSSASPRALLEAMNQTQFHRGPDEGDLHLAPGLAWPTAACRSSTWPAASSPCSAPTAICAWSTTVRSTTSANWPASCRPWVTTSAPTAIPRSFFMPGRSGASLRRPLPRHVRLCPVRPRCAQPVPGPRPFRHQAAVLQRSALG